jgi:transposase
VDQGYFWLNDEQFERLEPHLPTDTRGKPRVDDRRVISGIIHVLVSGCRWKDAPSLYGPRKTLYNRFQRWAAIQPGGCAPEPHRPRGSLALRVFQTGAAHRIYQEALRSAGA